MDNYTIADNFSLLSKLMDIHGENSFKAKSYSIAAFNIEKLPVQLSSLPQQEISRLKGIGDSLARNISELLTTGRLQALDEIVAKTPPGILEMMNIKGLGPKKINTIWKIMEIESIGELLYACQENRLLLFKGFGAKTQKNVQDAIEFYLKNQGNFLYAETEQYANQITERLSKEFSDHQISVTGAFRRQELTLSELEWVTTINKESLQHFFLSKGFALIADEPSKISLEGEEKIKLTFYCCNQSDFFQQLFRTSASPAFLEAWNTDSSNALSEEEIFSRANLSYISPCLRESADIIESAKQGKLPELICEKDIKGIIHTHSNWSDGVNTIEEMATALIEKGFEYLVISDHSKSAFYANGLTEVKIAEQHRYIDELNKKLAPFKIFKSIECDILNDGSLDYSDDILNSFDLVITSIHSNLKMTEEKAMQRLLKAIQHPATTILGHMTGRLLLSRSGYPVDHELIIEACAAHKVVIELNAHPRRLDIDWHWIKKATDKGVLISINPDAHSIEGFNDIRYGVLAAQKGLLQASQNLSSFSLAEFEHFLKTKK